MLRPTAGGAIITRQANVGLSSDNGVHCGTRGVLWWAPFFLWGEIMNIHESLEYLSDVGADAVRRRYVKTCAAALGGTLLVVLLLIGYLGIGPVTEPVAAQQRVSINE